MEKKLTCLLKIPSHFLYKDKNMTIQTQTKIKTILNSHYIPSIFRLKISWKLKSRYVDIVYPDVYKKILSDALSDKDDTFSSDLISFKDDAMNIITNFFTEKEAELIKNSQASSDDEFNINDFIIETFNQNFYLDTEYMIIYKNSTGKSFYNITRAADTTMAEAERKLNNTPKGLSIERIRRTITHCIRVKKEADLTDMLNAVKFTNLNDKFITKWIEVLFELYSIEKSELNIVLFKQMLYSIKRAIFGLTPPDIRLMYTFYSRTQGCGKSRFVSHLADPFKIYFTDQGTLDQLANKNELKSLTGEYRVIDIQELASEKDIDKSTYAALKEALTSSTVGGRVMYSIENERQKMISIFLSSTNFHIADIIRDETGMRRYFSFDFHNKIEGMDWKKIDKHWSYISQVYSYIDEEGEEYITDKSKVFKDLQIVQAEYVRRKDFITEWESITGNKILCKKEIGATPLSKIDLFKRLSTYCKTYESFNLKINTMRNILISRREIYPIVDASGDEIYYCHIQDKDTIYAQADKSNCTTVDPLTPANICNIGDFV